jgi:hypothetical protein
VFCFCICFNLLLHGPVFLTYISLEWRCKNLCDHLLLLGEGKDWLISLVGKEIPLNLGIDELRKGKGSIW